MKKWIITLTVLVVVCSMHLHAAETSEAEDRVRNKYLLAYGKQDDMTKPKASKKHDRVTISVNVQTQAKHEATTELTAQNSNTIDWKNWFIIKVEPDGSLNAIPRTDAADPNWEHTMESEHKGDGQTERIENFKTKISGEVIDVLPNGHLVVEARRAIKVNNEDQTMIFTGRVDPKDLDDTSLIDANLVIDPRIKFDGKGDVSQTIRRGWLSRIVDILKPF